MPFLKPVGRMVNQQCDEDKQCRDEGNAEAPEIAGHNITALEAAMTTVPKLLMADCMTTLAQLASEIADVHFQGSVRTVRSLCTEPVQKERLGDHLVGVFQQRMQDGILGWRQLYRSVVKTNLMACIIQSDLFKGQRRGVCIARIGSQVSLYTRKEFCRVEGLGQIVNRTAQKDTDFIIYIYLGTYDNDGDALDLCKDFLAGNTGQHQVKQDKIRFILCKQKKCLAAGVGTPDRVAFAAKNFF